MNKSKLSTVTCVLIFVVAVGSLLFVNNFHVYKIVFASVKKTKFNEADFAIKDFGIGNDGNPFLSVDGTPGGTIPQKENIGYAYIFVTDNGTFAVSSDWMYPQWHTHEITLDKNNCIVSMKYNGDAEVSDLVKVTKISAINVEKVMTAEFTLSDSDASICATKIFDSAP
ncbi:MAG: hypothetical protein QOK69_01585 [Nitrososphaeraceae archaeon]|nr:hypothetical protein [Nitrososphaeraceae archaeon]